MFTEASEVIAASNMKTYLKAYYYKKVGLVDLSTHGGKIKFEFGRPAQRCLDSQNSNLIFPPYVLKSTRPTFL